MKKWTKADLRSIIRRQRSIIESLERSEGLATTERGELRGKMAMVDHHATTMQETMLQLRSVWAENKDRVPTTVMLALQKLEDRFELKLGLVREVTRAHAEQGQPMGVGGTAAPPTSSTGRTLGGRSSTEPSPSRPRRSRGSRKGSGGTF